MTQDGEPVAAIVDYEAFTLLRSFFDKLQEVRTAGIVVTPAAWLLMCNEMVAGGYAEQCRVIA